MTAKTDHPSQERRQRTLTEKDLESLAAIIKGNHCQFTPAEVSTIREMLDRIAETKSIVWKGFLSMLFVIMLVAAALSVTHNIKVKIP